MAADDSSERLHLTLLPPQPTLEEIDEFIRQLTGKPMTPEDRAETQRLLDELAILVDSSSPNGESDRKSDVPPGRGKLARDD